MTTSQAPSTDPQVLLLDGKDNVCVACTGLAPGARVSVQGTPVEVRDRVPLGHKLARRDIAAGETVLKYGAPIGSASRDIACGEHVHTHNLRSNYLPTFTLDGSNPYLRQGK